MKTITGMFLATALVLGIGTWKISFGQVEEEFSRTYGGGNYEGCQSLIQTADGGYVMGGNTTSFGAGDDDIWLLKINEDGDSLWSHTFGGENFDGCNAVVQTADAGFAFAGATLSYGEGSGDFWFVKTNSDGERVLSNTYGGRGMDYANAMIQTTDGGFVLAGITQSYGAGSGDFWVVRINAEGDLLWSNTFGGGENESCYSIIQTSDGGFALAGMTSSFGSGYFDFWLVRTDENGDSLWSKTFGGEDRDICYSIVQTADDGFALAGVTDIFDGNETDFWLLRTDENGDSLWSQTFGGESWDWAYSLIKCINGGFAIAGSSEGNCYIVRTNDQGDSLWSSTFWGRQGYAIDPSSIVQTTDGGFALAGTLGGNLDFWFAKTTPDPIAMITHSIPFHYGWNMISSVCQPRSAEMPDVWAEVINRRNLIIAKDYSGHYFLPGIFNNMEPWDVRQGYWVKMDWRDTLTVVNIPVSTDTPIPLRQGWNIIAYFPEERLDVRDAFASIQDELLMVKDMNGRFYRAQIDFSNLQPLARGNGYQVAVREACELVYPDGEMMMMGDADADADGDGDADVQLVHFVPQEMTGANMSLLVSTQLTARAGFQSGEIGVFTQSGLCVGIVTPASSRHISPPSRRQFEETGEPPVEHAAILAALRGLAIWGDDPSTEEIDGAREGESISFRFWDGVDEKQVRVTWLEGDGTYQSDGFAQIRIDGVTALMPTELALEEPFPNPFNSTTTLRYSLPEASSIKLSVFDLAGREIVTLASGNRLSGVHNIVWSADGVGSGLYIVRLEAGLKTMTQKVLLVK